MAKSSNRSNSKANSKSTTKTTSKSNNNTCSRGKANMCKADYLKGSVPTEQHLAMYVHETLDDPDGCEGLVFNRWIADMKWLGIAIPWSDFI